MQQISLVLLLDQPKDFTAGLRRGGELFFQESYQASSEGSETQHTQRVHHLVAFQQILIIFDEGFHLPMDRQDVDQRLGVQIQRIQIWIRWDTWAAHLLPNTISPLANPVCSVALYTQAA